ncbi:MAG: hypothetical protein EXR50_06170 [Dehalococcoidia bacterium]|nr:hypothetical protein [Dehalococcoidia bacterium]
MRTGRGLLKVNHEAAAQPCGPAIPFPQQGLALHRRVDHEIFAVKDMSDQRTDRVGDTGRYGVRLFGAYIRHRAQVPVMCACKGRLKGCDSVHQRSSFYAEYEMLVLRAIESQGGT